MPLARLGTLRRRILVPEVPAEGPLARVLNLRCMGAAGGARTGLPLEKARNSTFEIAIGQIGAAGFLRAKPAGNG